jgi:hypothetical protein
MTPHPTPKRLLLTQDRGVTATRHLTLIWPWGVGYADDVSDEPWASTDGPVLLLPLHERDRVQPLLLQFTFF